MTQPPPHYFPSQSIQVGPQPVVVTQPPYFRSQEICCATARTLSNVIAWLQIVSSSILFVVAIIWVTQLENLRQTIYSLDFRAGLMLKKSFEKPLTSQNPADYADGFESVVNKIYAAILVFVICMAVLGAIGFVTGIFLQQGVSQRKPAFMTVWIISQVLMSLLSVGCSIALNVLISEFNERSILFFGNVGWNIFCIWVVSKHRSEVESFLLMQRSSSQSLGVLTKA